MNIDNCIHAIKASKKYNCICDEIIIRMVKNEIVKYNSEKDVIKSVKTRLHQITGAFIDEDSMKQAFGLLLTLNDQSMNEKIKKILSLHTSSMERMSFMEEIYEDIFSITGNDGAILDIACGFNPFFLPLFLKTNKIMYYATDINVKLIDLIHCFLHRPTSTAVHLLMMRYIKHLMFKCRMFFYLKLFHYLNNSKKGIQKY